MSRQINLLYLGLSLANSPSPQNFVSPFPLLFCTRIEIPLSSQFHPLNKCLMKCRLRSASMKSDCLAPLFQLTCLQVSPAGAHSRGGFGSQVGQPATNYSALFLGSRASSVLIPTPRSSFPLPFPLFYRVLSDPNTSHRLPIYLSSICHHQALR